MFETSRSEKAPEPVARPTMQRSNSGKAYVESEEAVISLMKTSSTVKARMAQFSGGSVSIDNTTEVLHDVISNFLLVPHKARSSFRPSTIVMKYDIECDVGLP